MILTKMQEELVNAYLNFVEKNKKHPSRNEMAKLGYNNNKIRRHFTSLTNLRKVTKEKYPEKFGDVVDSSLFTKRKLQLLQGEVAKYKKFIISTVVNDCKINKDFLASIENYCKLNNATLLLLPSHDPAHNLEKEHTWNFDSQITSKNLVFSDLKLNSNLFISTIKLSAKHIDPITGLERIGQRDGSFIYASPKQRLKYVATSNVKLPHAIMTTGAITNPNYKTSRYMSERTAYIAEHDHVLGAIIVEIENDDIYHFRQIQADSRGAFIDLGVKYSGTKTENVIPEAIILGDWHTTETDPTCKKVWFDMVNKLKPKILVIHDIFTGRSISHHNREKLLTKAKKVMTLNYELLSVASELNELTKLADKVIIVKSNHDEFLERYLETGDWLKDSFNTKICLELSQAVLAGENPLKVAVTRALTNPEKVIWLTRDEDFKIANVHLGAHGDIGTCGSKGNLRNLESSYGNCIVGHSHSAQILRNAYCVGTTTYLRLDYNHGPSNWTNTSCVLNKDGSKQLINNINGKWRKI